MKKILYYIFAVPFYIFSLLPFPVFYFVCDVFYIITYHLVGYRKEIVFTNLRNAFPEKDEKEIAKIAKGYYHFMIDLFLETLKGLTISEEELNKRIKSNDMTVPIELKNKNKSFLLVLGHFGNWEWGGQWFHLQHLFQQDVLYHPLSSGFFNRLFYKIRTRFGVHVIPMNSSIKEMLQRKNILTATAFIADQTPSNTKDVLWTTFLNQETPVFLGTEKIARKLDLPVVYVTIDKTKRGFYEVSFKLITDDPKKTSENFITEMHTRLLEQDIIKHPEIWLWSHRRWKHKRKLIG